MRGLEPRVQMNAKEIALRCFGFVTPWIGFSLLQYYLLHITAPYTLMLYGGVAAIVSLSVRDGLLQWLDSRQDA